MFCFEKEEKETLHRVPLHFFLFFLRVTFEFGGDFKVSGFSRVFFGLGDGFTSPKNPEVSLLNASVL